MRFYFGENGWPASKLGGPPRSDEEKNTLIDSLQVHIEINRGAGAVEMFHECRCFFM